MKTRSRRVRGDSHAHVGVEVIGQCGQAPRRRLGISRLSSSHDGLGSVGNGGPSTVCESQCCRHGGRIDTRSGHLDEDHCACQKGVLTVSACSTEPACTRGRNRAFGPDCDQSDRYDFCRLSPMDPETESTPG